MRFTAKTPITKGWSSDKKYCVTAEDGTKYLLRVSELAEHKRKKAEFDIMRKFAAAGIPMNEPVELSVCEDGVHMLLTWIDGEDLDDVLPTLSEQEQYALGVQAGEILRKMHAMEDLPDCPEWGAAYGRKIDDHITKYLGCGMCFAGDVVFLSYIERNRHLLIRRFPMCRTHGDYHVGNLMLSPSGELRVIDFERHGISTPWSTFTSIKFSANLCPQFATGQVRGYFGGEPPADFWELHAFFMAANNIHALPWSMRFGQKEIDFAHKLLANILHWHDDFRNPVPIWYLKDYTEESP